MATVHPFSKAEQADVTHPQIATLSGEWQSTHIGDKSPKVPKPALRDKNGPFSRLPPPIEQIEQRSLVQNSPIHAVEQSKHTLLEGEWGKGWGEIYESTLLIRRNELQTQSNPPEKEKIKR